MKLHMTLFKNNTFTITTHRVEENNIAARIMPLVELDKIELDDAIAYFYERQYRMSGRLGLLAWADAAHDVAKEFIASRVK